MKRIYISLILSGVACTAFAQRNGGNSDNLSGRTPVVTLQQLKAVGDTLMYFDGNQFLLADPQDNTDFVLEENDFDQLPPAVASSSNWMYFYSVDPNDLFPNDGDTAYYTAATSWFNPPGVADNWYSFGPITIPSGGATFKWYDRHNPSYTDGYDVYVSTTGAEPYTDVDPLVDNPMFTRATIKPPATQPGSDTLFGARTFSLDGFAGNRVYIHFHHNTNDGDVLALDEMTVIENDNQSVNESSVLGVKAYPNPASGMINFTAELPVAGTATIEIFDITGKSVSLINLGERRAGVTGYRHDVSGYAAGVYFYTLRAGHSAARGRIAITR